jgi:hypothetical protein
MVNTTFTDVGGSKYQNIKASKGSVMYTFKSTITMSNAVFDSIETSTGFGIL